jgi:iron complex outermembrane receptor protein
MSSSCSTRACAWRIGASCFAPIAIACLLLMPFSFLVAQLPTTARTTVIVRIANAEGQPVAGAQVTARRPSSTAPLQQGRSDLDGRVVLPDLPRDVITITVARMGFQSANQTIEPKGAEFQVEFRLRTAPQALGTIEVVALRSDEAPDQQADRARIQAATPHDAADVLRELPGTDAMRRGALGLDPVVRGLRDTQLGVYVDAARTLPGGPAGMDTPLSHVDPSHIQGIEVVSGPYALTWGAGNLSAIRVNTTDLPTKGTGLVHGLFGSGYDSNRNAQELTGTVRGAASGVRLLASAAGRSGKDYRAGNDQIIPADFRSSEARGKVGIATGRHSELVLTGSAQWQRDIDYPGRPLDATYFDARHWQAEWTYLAQRTTASSLGRWRFREAHVMGYRYTVDHEMDNDGKPTALANPSRTPPFPLLIRTGSGVAMTGARGFVRLDAPGGIELQAGGDLYDAMHEADRRTDRRDTGARVRGDLIWGGVRIADAGAYLRATRPVGRAFVAGTVRFDQVTAAADSVSVFFAQQYGAPTRRTEGNWSGAATVRLPLTSAWSVSTGIGSVVRTAEANERYSDRAAAKRAQTNAEFLGNPMLRPERSTQGDLWIEGRIGRTRLNVNVFARRLDDYITIEATSLPRSQAGSPPPVFRFINGRATYRGGEATLVSPLHATTTLLASVSALTGQDVTLAEPALGVTPVRGLLRLRIAPSSTWSFEPTWQLSAAQSRVAVTRGEKTTAGWHTVDLQGTRVWQSGSSRDLSLGVGIRNLFDRPYVHHLSALDAFSGARIPELGRLWFVRVTVGF